MKVPNVRALNDTYQRDIIKKAPRSVIYYVGQHGGVAPSLGGLIPDTPKTRKRAADEHGATHFDIFTFHRFNLDGTPGNHKFGDFYCQLVPLDSRMSIFDTMNTVIDLFRSIGLFSIPYCTLIYIGKGPLGAQKLGLSIPSSVFEMEDGGVILPALYEVIYEKMSVATAKSNVRVYFDGRIDDTCISPGIYAKPFRLAEIGTTVSLDDLVSKERYDYEHLREVRCMDSLILRQFKKLACSITKNRKDRQTTPAKNSEWPRPPQPECLNDPPHISVCGPEHADSASKCARKLLAWISERQIVEFGKRNAERALGEPLHGKSGKGGGVEDALRILIAGGYIQKCPSAPSGYKSSSPWYLVNPALAD